MNSEFSDFFLMAKSPWTTSQSRIVWTHRSSLGMAPFLMSAASWSTIHARRAFKACTSDLPSRESMMSAFDSQRSGGLVCLRRASLLVADLF